MFISRGWVAGRVAVARWVTLSIAVESASYCVLFGLTNARVETVLAGELARPIFCFATTGGKGFGWWSSVALLWGLRRVRCLHLAEVGYAGYF